MRGCNERVWRMGHCKVQTASRTCTRARQLLKRVYYIHLQEKHSVLVQQLRTVVHRHARARSQDTPPLSLSLCQGKTKTVIIESKRTRGSISLFFLRKSGGGRATPTYLNALTIGKLHESAQASAEPEKGK
jgi:hypothetical protein